MREQRHAYEELRNAELVEKQRLEEQHRRLEEEKQRRHAQHAKTSEDQKVLAEKVSCTVVQNDRAMFDVLYFNINFVQITIHNEFGP